MNLPMREPRGIKRLWIDQSVDVETDAKTLMTALSDIPGWSRWVPGLFASSLWGRGELREGRRFSMIVGLSGFPRLWLPNQLYRLSPLLLEWGGGGLGSVIRHRFELTPLGSQTTRLRHVEYATNALAVLCMPLEGRILTHDSAWTEAIRDRFQPTARDT